MGTRIVCVDPNAVGQVQREIAATGQMAAFGDEIEIEDAELAESLLEQEPVWARPTTTAAKEAKRIAGADRKRRADADAEPVPDDDAEPATPAEEE